MNIIVCLDDKNGMMFAGRRQSCDRLVYDRIIDFIGGNKLYMNSYSAKLFDKYSLKICADNDFLNKATKNDYCFIENADITDYIEKIEKIIIYRWNRVYPSDLKFSLPLSADKLISTTDFKGNSHKTITEEIYVL